MPIQRVAGSLGRSSGMIELPEAVTIAGQMNVELKGKCIAAIERGHTPHKFAFYTYPAEAYRSILESSSIGESTDHGNAILTQIGSDHVLVLGGGGERILYQMSAETLPEKHQLLLRFEDQTHLTVTVSGWGNVMLLQHDELADHPHVGEKRVSPLNEEFTWEHFSDYFKDLLDGDARSVKYFVVSKPGLWGVGNGCLQDILFQAKIHPRRKILDLSSVERKALHRAAVEMLTQAVALGGRDSERDLYNHVGGYQRIVHNRRVGNAEIHRIPTILVRGSFSGFKSLRAPI
jgi:formamidopyrimidine-DNA glycosylase